MPSASSKPKTSAGQPGTGGVPWNPWWGMGFAILVFVGSQLASVFILALYTGVRRWPSSRALDWLNTSVVAQFLFVLIAESLVIGAVYLFLRRHKAGWSAIGLRRPRWSDPGYGLLAAPFYFILFTLTVVVVKLFVPELDVSQTQQLGFNDVVGPAALVMTFISLVILPPLAEEIMMRGFVYGTLKKLLPLLSAAVTTSLLFAIAHLPEGGEAGPLYIAAIDTFVLSLVLIYLREKTSGLWAPITLHTIKNGVAFVALFILHVR